MAAKTVKVTDAMVKDVMKRMLSDWAFFLGSADAGKESPPITLELRLSEIIEEYEGIKTWIWEINNMANCMYESKNEFQKLMGPHWLVLDFHAYESHDEGREYDILIQAKHYRAFDSDRVYKF